MKIIFMGTPEFSVLCLKRLIFDGHDVVLTLTQEDKPKGRGYVLTPPPVKVYALSHGIEVFQPKTLRNNGEALQRIAACQADVIIVVAYGRILPPEVLALPKHGCINVHASLLPGYRGAAPIQWSILNGESETGVTTMQMDSGLDTGDMLLKRKVEITQDMTAGELHDLLSVEGAEVLSETLRALENGTLSPQNQEDAKSCYAPILTRDLSPIDWNKDAKTVHNQIRGLNPWPSAVTTLGGKAFKIHRSRPVTGTNVQPGTVIHNAPLTVACGGGSALELLEVQCDGTKRMSADDFLRGHPIQTGRVLPD